MQLFTRANRLLILFLFICVATWGSAPTSNAQEVNEKIITVFVYNFTKYIKWPETSGETQFVIGVPDNVQVVESFEKMAAASKVNGQSIIIKKIKNTSDAETCKIIYLSRIEAGKLKDLADFLKDKPVLIVASRDGAVRKGADINFFIDEDDNYKTRFEINQGTIESRGLKVSKDLLNLAYTVIK